MCKTHTHTHTKKNKTYLLRSMIQAFSSKLKPTNTLLSHPPPSPPMKYKTKQKHAANLGSQAKTIRKPTRKTKGVSTRCYSAYPGSDQGCTIPYFGRNAFNADGRSRHPPCSVYVPYFAPYLVPYLYEVLSMRTGGAKTLT